MNEFQELHSVEYELTSEFATKVQRSLAKQKLGRGWRQDLPTFLGAVLLIVLIIILGLKNLLSLAVGSGLIFLVMLFVIGTIYRRLLTAQGASAVALLALQSGERRVRIGFSEKGLRMETDFFRGEGAWTELEEILVFPDYWVFYLANGGQVLLPVSKLTPKLENFLRDKAAGVNAPLKQGVES